MNNNMRKLIYIRTQTSSIPNISFIVKSILNISVE